MTIATDIIDAHTIAQNGLINYEPLMEDLDKYEHFISDIDQDLETDKTTWTFADGSAMSVSGNEVHAYGSMPNTDKIDWYFAGFMA